MQTLFTSDRMIVKGRQSEYGCSIPTPSDSILPEEINSDFSNRYIELEFIFQVNGKLTQYLFRQTLDKTYLNLSNWDSWNSVIELFNCMGYSFGESSLNPNYGIIRKWAEMTSYKEQIG